MVIKAFQPSLYRRPVLIILTLANPFGSGMGAKLPKNEIVDTMHKEDAYTETAPHDIIQFKYAKTLSLT